MSWIEGVHGHAPSAGPAALRRLLTSEPVRPWLLLAPVLVVVVGLFLAAVALATVQSFGFLPLPGAVSEPSAAAYRNLAAGPELGRSLLLTLYLATVSTTLSVVLGIGAALVLRRVTAGSRVLRGLFQLSLPIPHVVGAIAVLALLGQSGLVSRVLDSAGVIDGAGAFPALVFDPWAVGIIVEYVWKEVPFIGIVALALLRSARVEEAEAQARSLGAGPWQRLRHVTLPLALPGVLAAAVIVFAFTFGAFEVPLLLGRSFPEALPVLAYRRFVHTDLALHPEAMAVSVLITLVAGVCVVAAMWLARRTIRGD